MKTTIPKKDDIKRAWHLVDANGVTLGKAATEIANYLRGKNKACFTPHLDCGDYIVVINADKIALSGNKESDKIYYSHSGYRGGLKEMSAAKMRKEKPEQILYKAVYGMLPSNRLRNGMLERLKIFNGAEHTHGGQNPQPLEIK